MIQAWLRLLEIETTNFTNYTNLSFLYLKIREISEIRGLNILKAIVYLTSRAFFNSCATSERSRRSRVSAL